MKAKAEHIKTYRHSESSAKWKCIVIDAYIKNQNQSQITNLNLQFKKIEKNKLNPNLAEGR